MTVLWVVGYLGFWVLVYISPVLIALFKHIDAEDMVHVILMTVLGFLIYPWFLAMALALVSPSNR